MNGIETLFFVIAAIWIVRILFRFANDRLIQWANDNSNKAQRRKQDALRSYIETGQINSAVRSLNGRAFQTIVTKRGNRVLEKAKESRKFEAWCECPACGESWVHWLKSDGTMSVTRTCRSCSYEWEQK